MDWQETSQGAVSETLETSDGDVEKSGGCAEAEMWMDTLTLFNGSSYVRGEEEGSLRVDSWV